MAKKKAAKKSVNIDFFQKAYVTVTKIADTVMTSGQQKIDAIVIDAEKRAVYVLLIAFPVLFLLLAIAELISSFTPWFGNAPGYVIVSFVLFVIASFYKKGMS